MRDWVGKRVLATTRQVGYSGSFGGLEEDRILEVSPGGGYVRAMNAYGNKVWRKTEDMAIVEALLMPERLPRDNQ